MYARRNLLRTTFSTTGFPDWDPPTFVQNAMATSVNPQAGRHANQYARSYAHMPLAKVLAEDYSERWKRQVDPETEIATAVGCTNALYCALVVSD